jgi:hypothetical protein
MPKRGRQQAIQAELARRAAATGVPPHLQVYTVRPQYGDEGGPRRFLPASFVERSHTSDAGSAQFDLDVVRRLVDRALSTNEPVELSPSTDRSYAPDAPYADYCEVSATGCTLIVLSSAADEVLHQLLAPCGRFVPVRCAGHPLVGFELTAVEDVLDVAKSEGSWFPPKTRERASRISRHAFHTAKLGAASMFRIPQHWQQYVLGSVVEAVEKARLTGFRFEQVWPHPVVGGRYDGGTTE